MHRLSSIVAAVLLAFAPAQSARAEGTCPPSGIASATLPRTSVRDFGARGDGLADDTCAFLQAIDAVQPGGKLLVPRGLYRITRALLIAKPFNLVGQGFFDDGSPALQGPPESVVAAWTRSFDGSVVWFPEPEPGGLRISAIVNLQDLLIVGHQQARSGVSLSSTASQQDPGALCPSAALSAEGPIIGARWQNVRVVNADCGVVLKGLAQSRFDRLQIRGARLGLLLLPGSDGNTFYSTDVEDSSDIGIEIAGAQQARFLSGTIQGSVRQVTQHAPAWTDFVKPSPHPATPINPPHPSSTPVGLWLRDTSATKVESFWFADPRTIRTVVIQGGVANTISRSLLPLAGQCVYVLHRGGHSSRGTQLLDLDGNASIASDPGVELNPVDCFLARTQAAAPCPDFGTF